MSQFVHEVPSELVETAIMTPLTYLLMLFFVDLEVVLLATNYLETRHESDDNRPGIDL